MFKKVTFLGTLAGFGFLLGAISGAIAAEMPASHSTESTHKTTKFQRIEQPLNNKIAVTLGGLGLIGLELWWFLLSKPKSQKAVTADGGIQEVTVTVDGGYEPSRIVVQAGKPVRLNFFRKDKSSCLEQVLIPEFHIAVNLPLNEETAVEFTPEKAGEYAFTCGMNMFRGVIQVEAQLISSQERKIREEIQPALSTSTGRGETRAEAQQVQSVVEQGVQKIAIAVNRGYAPKHVVVKVGQPVQLNFLRQNPSGCLAKVLLPDFLIAADLPLNKVTSVEFTPEKEGEYAFTCGMNMFGGVIEVRAANASSPEKFSTPVSASPCQS